MIEFTREECAYTNFHVKCNQNITFSCGEKGRDIIISIPITDDVPKCIKDKLNEVLWESMNNALKKQENFDCMFRPPVCTLDAKMQVIYDWELGVQYYLALEVRESEMYEEVYFDDFVLICKSDYELHNEFASYCRYKLDKILFPLW